MISWRKRSSWQPEIMMDQPLKNPQDTGKKWGFWREPGQMEKALAALEFESCLECLLFFFFILFLIHLPFCPFIYQNSTIFSNVVPGSGMSEVAPGHWDQAVRE